MQNALAPSLGELRFESIGASLDFGLAGDEASHSRLRILAVGWSESLLSLVAELKRYSSEQFALSLVGSVTAERQEAPEAALGANVELEILPFRLRSLKVSRDYLSKPLTEFCSSLLITRNRPRPMRKLPYQAPLFGPDQDVVITDQVINHMLAQI